MVKRWEFLTVSRSVSEKQTLARALLSGIQLQSEKPMVSQSAKVLVTELVSVRAMAE